MKRLLVLIVIVLLVGCAGDDRENKYDEEENETIMDPEKDKFIASSPMWEYSLDVDITHNFEGLDIHFQEIRLASEGNYLAFKVFFKNLSHNKFTVYPGQMEIKLDNGEEISFRDMVAEFEVGNHEITEKAETFEGFYVFETMTPVLDINKINVKWTNYKMDHNDEVDDYFRFESNLTIN
ncbi:hypothetical protein ACLIA0_06390 [Bacillaceae bacterium W0354]